ncbi:MAG: hypothetical protein Q8T11_03410 [Elusimicrobiota bacterium]|nr:hypothetical protein [Elusimicrobiota bacterium]
MARNKNTAKKDRPAPPLSYEPLSAVGKRLIGMGGALVIAGFVILSFADPLGRNLPALVSPFLLIGGYAAIGVGLFLPSLPPAPPSA